MNCFSKLRTPPLTFALLELAISFPEKKICNHYLVFNVQRQLTCWQKSLLIYWLTDDIVEWWHGVWQSKQYMIVWLKRIDLHVTVQPTLPPLLAMSWIRPPHVHSPPGFSDYSSILLKVFFWKNYLGKEGQDGCKEGQHPPHSPDLGPNLRSNPLEMSLSPLCCPFLPGAHFYFMI